MDMPEEHRNFDVCNRVLDLLYTMNEIERKYEQPKLQKQKASKEMIKAAFMKKLEGYKQIAKTHKFSGDLKTAFLRKIQQQREKIQKMEQDPASGDEQQSELPADSLRVPNQSLRM